MNANQKDNHRKNSIYDNLIQNAYTQKKYKNAENPSEESDIILSINKEFYHINFNAPDYIFKKHIKGNHFDLQDISNDRNILRYQLQILSKRISDLILQKSLLYSSELLKVQNLDTQLKDLIKILIDGRSNIKFGLSYISNSSLKILKNMHKKKNYFELLNHLQVIQKIQKANDRFKLELNKYDFFSAIQLCFETRDLIKNYPLFTCLKELHNKIQDALEMIEEHMDQALSQTTTQFYNNTNVKTDNWAPYGLYDQLYKAQKLLGKGDTALDQLLMHYSAAIHNCALEIVKAGVIRNNDSNVNNSKNFGPGSDILTSYENIVNTFELTAASNPKIDNIKNLLRRSQYPELCENVINSNFVPCLLALMTRFIDIMTCYCRTITWYKSNVIAPSHKDVGNLDQSISLADDINDSPPSLNTANYVIQKLRHGIIRIDQDIQQKIIILLERFSHRFLTASQGVQEESTFTQLHQANFAIHNLSFDDFLTFLRATSRFAKICTSFSCNPISNQYNLNFVRLTEQYVKYFHKLKIDEIKMFLENETWHACPVKRKFRLTQLQEYKFLKKKVLRKDCRKRFLDNPANNPLQDIPQLSTNQAMSDKSNNTIDDLLICTPFEMYLINVEFSKITNLCKLQNFVFHTDNLEYITPILKDEDESNVQKYEKYERNEINKILMIQDDDEANILSEDVIINNQSSLGDGVQDASFEQSFKKNSLKSNSENTFGYLNRTDLAPILTNTALNILRLVGKYLNIQEYCPSECFPIIEQNILQLYESYLYTIYQLVIGKFNYQMVGYLLSPGLVDTIEEIHRDCFFDHPNSDFPKSFNPFTNTSSPSSIMESSEVISDVQVTSNQSNDIYKGKHLQESRRHLYNYNLIDNLLRTYLVGTESLLYLNHKISSLITYFYYPERLNSLNHTSCQADLSTTTNDVESLHLTHTTHTFTSTSNAIGDSSNEMNDRTLVQNESVLVNDLNRENSYETPFNKPNHMEDNDGNEIERDNCTSPPTTNAFTYYPTEIQRLSCYILSLYVLDYDALIQFITLEQDWDLTELSSIHSSYVHYIIQSFKNLANHLGIINAESYNFGGTPVPKEFNDMLWQNLISITFRSLVDGYSLIKKCSNEGRALMQLDYQHLLLYITDIAKLKKLPDKEFAENYIKAYYLPESEIEEWINKHQEYSHKHLTSLINIMNNLTKKTKNRLFAIIEDKFKS